jgi:hypothetical protein
LFSYPITTRRLIIAGRPLQTSLTETTQVPERKNSLFGIFKKPVSNLGNELNSLFGIFKKPVSNLGNEQVTNIESTDLHEQLQSQKTQIQELTERLNRIEKQQDAHEIVELE